MRRYRNDIRTGLLVFGAVLTLGVPAGFLWEAITPKVQVIARGGLRFYAQPEGSAPIAADGNFALIGLVAGILCAFVAFGRYRSRYGVATVLGLSAGGVAASLLAWKIGYLLGPGQLTDTVPPAGDGVPFAGPLELRAYGVLLLWALASTTVFLALTASNDADDEPASEPLPGLIEPRLDTADPAGTGAADPPGERPWGTRETSPRARWEPIERE